MIKLFTIVALFLAASVGGCATAQRNMEAKLVALMRPTSRLDQESSTQIMFFVLGSKHGNLVKLNRSFVSIGTLDNSPSHFVVILSVKPSGRGDGSLTIFEHHIFEYTDGDWVDVTSKTDAEAFWTSFGPYPPVQRINTESERGGKGSAGEEVGSR
jgi:hypothetical protein